MHTKFVETMEAYQAHARLSHDLALKQAAYVKALREKGFALDESIAEAQRAIPIPRGPSIADIENSFPGCVAPGVFMAVFPSDSQARNRSFIANAIAKLRSLFM